MEEEIKTGEGEAQENTPESATAPEGEAKPERTEEGVREEGEKAPADEKPAEQTRDCNAVEIYDAKGKVFRAFTRKDGEDFVEQALSLAKANNFSIGYK